MKWFETRLVVVSVLGLCLLLAVDVPTARADFVFGEPVEMRSINASGRSFGVCPSADGLELYFARGVPGAGLDIFVACRPTVDSEWGTPVNLGQNVNSPANDWSASISADGLSLYFISGRDDSARLYVTKRPAKDAPWGPRVSVGDAVNTANASMPSISADELELYFSSNRPGGYGNNDLWMTTRATADGDWGPPVNLGPGVNSQYPDLDPAISPDGLLLFFDSRDDSNRWGTYVTRRATKNDPWGPRTFLASLLNISDYTGTERPGAVSSDGSMLYVFCDLRRTIWEVPILPVVDFNGDEIVDMKDLLMLVEHWGQTDSRYDIGPFPWGDGVVDAADLEVFMRYWGQEILHPAPIARWTFDEIEGLVVHDSVGEHHATVIGVPLWRPQEGRTGGALELDGATCATADSPINSADGSFTVMARVQGGAPGQVVISQQNGSNWLMANPTTGTLRTELEVASPRLSPGLVSEAVITDGNWHRITLTWDGTNRRLYVDGVLVAEDTRAHLPSSTGKLVFGAGKDMAPGTFWTGLIDDVRIYNRVVRP
jgi:hypothetical protein